jgi:phage terminase large subunit
MAIVLNSIYQEAHKTKKRTRVLYGGSGSGKSYFVAQETILNMLSDNRYRYLCVRKTGKSIRNSVFEQLVSMIKEYDLYKYFDINKTEMSITCLNGAKLITSGLDDVEKLKSIAGINRIWIEEASEISEADLEQLDLRLRGHNEVGYQITLTFNPISELHWLKKKYFDLPNDAYIIKTTYKDNKHLDDEYIKKIEQLKDYDYQYYRIYALGEWGSMGNLIFTNWEVAEIDKSVCDNFYNGVDFGFADDPFVFLRVHYDKKHRTIYVLDEIYEKGLHNDEASRLMKPLVNNEIVMCDSAEPKSISELRRYDINAKGVKKGKDSVMAGIKWIQQHKVVIDKSCINTIKEFSGYKWKEDKDGNTIPKPIDINNHTIDTLRYALEPTQTDSTWGWK